jgi:hypothetical protein
MHLMLLTRLLTRQRSRLHPPLATVVVSKVSDVEAKFHRTIALNLCQLNPYTGAEHIAHF